jgi:hypothetical protein
MRQDRLGQLARRWAERAAGGTQYELGITERRQRKGWCQFDQTRRDEPTRHRQHAEAGQCRGTQSAEAGADACDPPGAPGSLQRR